MKKMLRDCLVLASVSFAFSVPAGASAAGACSAAVDYAASSMAKAHLVQDGGRVFIRASEAVEVPELMKFGISTYRIKVQLPGEAFYSYLVQVNRRTCRVVSVGLEG